MLRSRKQTHLRLVEDKPPEDLKEFIRDHMFIDIAPAVVRPGEHQNMTANVHYKGVVYAMQIRVHDSFSDDIIEKLAQHIHELHIK